MNERFVTRQSNPEILEKYKIGSAPLEHWSPNGCHEIVQHVPMKTSSTRSLLWRLNLGEECNRVLDEADHLEALLKLLPTTSFKPEYFQKQNELVLAMRAVVAHVNSVEELDIDPNGKKN